MNDQDLTSDEVEVIKFDDETTASEALHEKMQDLMIPGFIVEFDPDEAERAGAFQEDALTEADALESGIDLVDID